MEQSEAWGLKQRRLEWCVYAAVAAIGVAPALLAGSHVVGDGVDLYGTIWFFWWVRDCLEHFRSPGFTDLFFHPLGKDIFAHTGSNFVDAYLSVPFQWVLGFPTWQPVFTGVLLFGNAWTFRKLAIRVIGLGPAAFAATLLWQTSSYVLFEITAGRPTQALLWFLPLAIERWLAFESHGRWRDAFAAGLFWACQAWTYWFMGHFIGLALLWLWLGGRSDTVDRKRFVLGIMLCAGSALVLVAPGLISMWLAVGAERVPGLSSPEAGLFDPPGSVDNNVSTTLHGYWLMERLGCPMLLHVTWLGGLAVALVWGRAKWRWIGLAAITLFVAFGPNLPAGSGASVRSLPYLLAYNVVPFFDRLWFPYRMLSVVFLALSVAIGLGLKGLFARYRLSDRAKLACVLGVLCISLFEQNRWATWPFVARDVEVPKVYDLIGEHGGGVIHLPIGVNQPAIIWQTIHHQPVWGGMGENARALWPEGYDRRLRIPFIRYLTRALERPEQATPPSGDGGRSGLESEGFRWIVLHRDYAESIQFQRGLRPGGGGFREDLGVAATKALIAGLGDPVAVEGSLVVWHLQREIAVPEELRPTQTRLETKIWAQEGVPAYEKILRERGRLDALEERDQKDAKAPRRMHQPGGPSKGRKHER